MSLNLTWGTIKGLNDRLEKEFDLKPDTILVFEIRTAAKKPIIKKTSFSTFLDAMWDLFDKNTVIRSFKIAALAETIYQYKGLTASVLHPNRIPTTGNRDFISGWPQLTKSKRESFIKRVLIPQIRNYELPTETN